MGRGRGSRPGLASCQEGLAGTHLDVSSGSSGFSNSFSSLLLLLPPLLAGLLSEMGPTWLMLQGSDRHPGHAQR